MDPPPAKRIKTTDEDNGSLLQWYASDIVTLIVGGPASPAQEAEPKKFFLHESLLVEASPVFRAMLSRPQSSFHRDGEEAGGQDPVLAAIWAEAKDNMIHLPEDRVEDWAMLMQWLYVGGSTHNKIPTKDDNKLERTALLEQIKSLQPDLADPEAELAMSDHITWRRSSRVAKATLHNAKLYAAPYDPMCIRSSLRRQELEGIIDSSDGKYKWDLEKATVEYKRVKGSRPAPPSLGRLVRLYILADKYAVDEGGALSLARRQHPGAKDAVDVDVDIANTATDTGEPTGTTQATHTKTETPPKNNLNATPAVTKSTTPVINRTPIRTAIISRIRAIHSIANVVPNAEDIKRLYSSIIAENDAMKGAVVELYAKLDAQALVRILKGVEGMGVGVEMGVGASVAEANWSRSGNGKRGQDPEWNAGFLRDLLVRRARGGLGL